MTDRFWVQWHVLVSLHLPLCLSVVQLCKRRQEKDEEEEEEECIPETVTGLQLKLCEVYTS